MQRLGVALLIGLLIGLDRERTQIRNRAGMLFAGVRTFPLVALAGALPMLVAPPMGVVLLAAAFLAVASIAAISYLRSSAAGEMGTTTEISAFATFILGALAGGGHLVVAAATGVIIAVLLAAKPRIEAFSRALTSEEIAAILELAVISIIVLPLMPKRGFGPWEVLNPFEIWLIVVLVSGLSLLGFVAMRLAGEKRGLAITGLVGGLVSSTAITLSMAERSREARASAGALASATVLACTVMCVRVAVLGAIVNSGILIRLLPTLGGMTFVGLLSAWLLQRADRDKSGHNETRLSNPFSLRRAITFGAIYAAVRFVVRAAQELLGSTGMFVAAFLASLADVDAPTIAFARGGPVGGSWRDPSTAVAIAAIGNTLVKLGLARSLGAGDFRRRVVRSLGAMALVGAITTWIVHMSS
jgi:uncharacterized membrane protein (DUF4010 family)